MFENFFAKMAGKYLAGKLNLQENENMGTKPWYQSKTLWSDIATIAVSIVGLVDAHFTGGKIASSPYYQGILAVLGGVGIYGRSTATTKIG
jgi:hypothetical protein